MAGTKKRPWWSSLRSRPRQALPSETTARFQPTGAQQEPEVGSDGREREPLPAPKRMKFTPRHAERDAMLSMPSVAQIPFTFRSTPMPQAQQHNNNIAAHPNMNLSLSQLSFQNQFRQSQPDMRGTSSPAPYAFTFHCGTATSSIDFALPSSSSRQTLPWTSSFSSSTESAKGQSSDQDYLEIARRLSSVQLEDRRPRSAEQQQQYETLSRMPPETRARTQMYIGPSTSGAEAKPQTSGWKGKAPATQEAQTAVAGARMYTFGSAAVSSTNASRATSFNESMRTLRSSAEYSNASTYGSNGMTETPMSELDHQPPRVERYEQKMEVDKFQEEEDSMSIDEAETMEEFQDAYEHQC